MTDLRQELEREKAKAKELWREDCIQAAESDGILSQMEEIVQLWKQLAHSSHVGSAHSRSSRLETDEESLEDGEWHPAPQRST